MTAAAKAAAAASFSLLLPPFPNVCEGAFPNDRHKVINSSLAPSENFPGGESARKKKKKGNISFSSQKTVGMFSRELLLLCRNISRGNGYYPAMANVLSLPDNCIRKEQDREEELSPWLMGRKEERGRWTEYSSAQPFLSCFSSRFML